MNNDTYENRQRELIDEITTAFDGVSRENGVSLSESWVIDNYGSDEECAEARRQDIEAKWQDVPDEDISNGYSCLNFLDEIGFHYYTPAYIVWFLRNMDNDTEVPGFYDSNTFEFLIYALGASGSGDLDEVHLTKYRLFTPEQSKAVARFLQFLAEYNEDSDAQTALNRYWQKFV